MIRKFILLPDVKHSFPNPNIRNVPQYKSLVGSVFSISMAGLSVLCRVVVSMPSHMYTTSCTTFLRSLRATGKLFWSLNPKPFIQGSGHLISCRASHCHAQEDSDGTVCVCVAVTATVTVATHELCFIWGYYGTQYRVRFYPPFGA